MKKERLRFLALGFFISALILSAFQLIFPSAKDSDRENVAQGTDNYEEMYEDLLVEYNQLFAQFSGEESKTVAQESVGATPEASSIESEGLEEETEPIGEGEENPLQVAADTPFVFLIHEGQPSSVVLRNLWESGLIESVESAEAYLEEHHLLTAIQYGSYTLSKNMPDVEVLNSITVQ